MKPTQILEKLCKKHNIAGPMYVGGHVVLGTSDEKEAQQLLENVGKYSFIH